MKRRNVNLPKISVHPRSLARSMARAEFERQGVTGYNQKPGRDLEGRAMPSPFARGWKKIVTEAVKARPRKERRK